MSPDPNKKSERAFQCRDILWETFEQMARELECSVDYLINEAMKQYARQRSRVGRTDSVPAAGGGSLGASPIGAIGARGVPMPSPSGSVGGGMHGPGPPSMTLGPRPALPGPPLPVAGGYLPPPPLPPPPVIAPRLGATLGGTLSGRPPLPAPPSLGSRPPMLGAPPPLPAPLPLSSPMQAPHGSVQAPAQGGRVLVAFYMGEQVPITKDRFVIGRGRQSSDLTIKDPNVSRQHAMVEFHSGQYYMVDLGSTNGVEYNGQRITKQLIVDGDTFRICDHEVRFVFA
jgi:hypothetical protein